MTTENKKVYLPIPVTKADTVFGGKCKDILPKWEDIPDEFKAQSNPWCQWQSNWFFHGLANNPIPKEGTDGDLAMANLQCVQGSFEPKHQHKQAGVAYLASLWFVAP